MKRWKWVWLAIESKSRWKKWKKNQKNRKRKNLKIEKGKRENQKKRKIQKKIQKIRKKEKKKKAKSKKIRKRKEKKLFPVVLDKICVFCLYPIPYSQQYVKRGSCRRPILSGLLCLFLFWASGPFVTSSNLGLEPCPLLLYRVFESFWVSYLFRVYFVFNCYLSLNVMFCCIVSCHIVFFILIFVCNKCRFI